MNILELVELFIETSKSDLKNLQSAINNKDMEMIAGISPFSKRCCNESRIWKSSLDLQK